MTKPDDLVAGLEQLSMRGHPVAGRASWRIQRLTAENKALREALRLRSFTMEHGFGVSHFVCCLCGGKWKRGEGAPDEPERHSPGCLAAGAANER